MEQEEEELIGYAQAAALLGMKLGTLYALVSQKRVPHVRISGRLVRFYRSQLRGWLASKSVVPVVGAPTS